MTLLFLIIFFIGLGFGSFSSVIIFRLHNREKGIMCGRSKCPACKHTLNAIDLIPLFGFLINRGKCRYCKKKISIIYPILEITMGLVFALTAYMTGLFNTLPLVFNLFLAFIFTLLSFYDIFYQEIPDEISIPTIIISGLVVIFGHLNNLGNMMIGFGVPVFFFSSLFILSRGRWLGGGDIRIGAIMGFVLGWPNVITGLFLGYMIGSIYSAFGLISGRLTRKSQIPFGPFLFIGTYIAMFWGKDLMDWYLNMM